VASRRAGDFLLLEFQFGDFEQIVPPVPVELPVPGSSEPRFFTLAGGHRLPVEFYGRAESPPNTP
jgi:hypothetical protein